jgi:hypothetical protein
MYALLCSTRAEYPYTGGPPVRSSDVLTLSLTAERLGGARTGPKHRCQPCSYERTPGGSAFQAGGEAPHPVAPLRASAVASWMQLTRGVSWHDNAGLVPRSGQPAPLSNCGGALSSPPWFVAPQDGEDVQGMSLLGYSTPVAASQPLRAERVSAAARPASKKPQKPHTPHTPSREAHRGARHAAPAPVRGSHGRPLQTAHRLHKPRHTHRPPVSPPIIPTGWTAAESVVEEAHYEQPREHPSAEEPGGGNDSPGAEAEAEAAEDGLGESEEMDACEVSRFYLFSLFRNTSVRATQH